MCVPSRWEGFGIVFIEAAACGAAIVTSDIAPMKEYLTHEVSAHLVKEYENPTALARAISQVCENSEYRRRLSAGAIKAAQPFDRSIVDAKEVAIYQEAMNLAPLPWALRLRRVAWRVWKSIGFGSATQRKRLAVKG
jgi:glycosyltransferase involved in cell wall biosynthesis